MFYDINIMNQFLLGAFCLAVAVTIIVLIKVIFGNLRDRDDHESFVVEDNTQVTELEPETLDFSNIMPEPVADALQIDNSTNYPSQVDAPPEIFSTPRVSSFSSHIRV
jgi:hypothetical protein